MGVVQRFERKLQSAVGDAFARVFGGGVVPQEVEAALQQEASDQVRELDGGHLLAPNSYVITISTADHEQMAADRDLTTKAFSRHLEGFIAEQGWQTYGKVVVDFEPSAALHTGQFRTTSSVDPDAGRRARPAPSAPPVPARVEAPSPAPPAPSPSPTSTVHTSSTTGAGPMTQNSGTQNQGNEPEHDGVQSRAPRNGSAYPSAPRGEQQGGPVSENRVRPPQAYQDYPSGSDGQDRGEQDADRGPAASYDQPYGQPGYGQPDARGRGPQGYDQRGYDPQGYDQQGYQPDPRAPRGYEPRPYDQRGYDQQGYQPDPRGPRGYEPRPYDQRGYEQQGYDQPAYDQQGYDQRGYDQQGYGRPAAEEQPAYDQQAYGRAPYDQPAYDQPAYDQPAYDQPGYDQQSYGAPAAQAYGAAPAYDQPATQGYQAVHDDDDHAPAASASRGLTATLQLEDGSGRYYQLREGGNVVGRGQEAQFRLPDTGVSRRHFEIRWDNRVAMLSDLGSTNGTTVNGAPVQDWQLADGDIVRAGHSEILVRVV